MSIKRMIQRIYIRSQKRKNKVPKMSDSERSVVDVVLSILRKKDSILLNAPESKKIIIKNNNTQLILDHGLLIIDDTGSCVSLLISETINTYILKEFNRIKNKKMHRIEKEMANNCDLHIENILKKIKNEKINIDNDVVVVGKHLITG